MRLYKSSDRFLLGNSSSRTLDGRSRDRDARLTTLFDRAGGGWEGVNSRIRGAYFVIALSAPL